MARLRDATIHEAHSFASAYLLPDNKIAGIGIANPKPKINVYVKDEKDLWEVPGEIGGYETKPILAGQIRAGGAMSQSQYYNPNLPPPPPSAYRATYRPSPGGVSIGPQSGDAGTFGTVVYDKVTGERLMLTNNHVAADANRALIGSPIYQPSRMDTPLGVAAEVLGHLAGYVTLYGDGYNNGDPAYFNQVDAALVKPILDQVYDEVLGIGVIQEAVPPVLGTPVVIADRNGFGAGGKIIDRSATFKVSEYPPELAGNPDGLITFYNCVVVSPTITAPGASGGIFVNQNDYTKGMALNFAGSQYISIANWLTSALELTGTVMPGEYARGIRNYPAAELPPGVLGGGSASVDPSPSPLPNPGTIVDNAVLQWLWSHKLALGLSLGGFLLLVALASRAGRGY